MSERTEFGFIRTIADGPLERLNCKYIPGYLIPADLERIASAMGATNIEAWAMDNLLASPGATVARMTATGLKPFQIHTLVPARAATGHCIHLCEQGCKIHPVAPFGCAFFDNDQSMEEAQRKSSEGLKAIMAEWEKDGPYAQIWKKLDAAGKKAPWPRDCRAKLAIAYERLKRKGKI